MCRCRHTSVVVLNHYLSTDPPTIHPFIHSTFTGFSMGHIILLASVRKMENSSPFFPVLY